MPAAAYTSVQTGRDSHVELNSDLVYCNHSCAPSLEFDTAAAGRPRGAGTATCARATPSPSGTPRPSGAWRSRLSAAAARAPRAGGGSRARGEMSEQVVRAYWLNPHIEDMLDERAGLRKGGKGCLRGRALILCLLKR